MTLDAKNALGQVEQLMDVARAVAVHGLVVYRCGYDCLTFGSWFIESGSSHRRLRIVWDGSDGTLRCSTACLQNASAIPEWEERKTVSIDRARSAADFDTEVSALLQEYGACS